MTRNLISIVLPSILALGIAVAPALAEEPEESAFIGVMSGYLDVADKYTELASRPDAAIYFALEGIVEVHQRRGELDKAVTELESILEQHGKNQAVRNLVRFKLRDLYNETGRSQKALDQLNLIIAENAVVPPSR